MNRLVAAALIAALSGPGCDGGEAEKPAEPAAKKPTCELSLDALSGDWARIVSTPQGEALDGFFRVRFLPTEPGATPKLIATAGTLNKMTYSMAEKTDQQVVFLQDRDVADIEKFKAENKNPVAKMQGKLKIRLDKRKCRLVMDDLYLTYVDGQLQEHFNEAMTSNYAKADKTYSFEQCNEPSGLRYSAEAVDASKVKPPRKGERPMQERIAAGAPAHFYQYLPTEAFDPACQTSFDAFVDGARLAENQTMVADAKGGKVLIWSHTFEPSSMGLFVEFHRFKNCNGAKTLAGVSCGVVLPE